MKKTLFLMAMVAMTFAACNNGKSEAEIRKEIQAEMQHKQDSVRLAEAEQRASEAEAKAEEAAKKADAASAKAEKAKKAADNVNLGTMVSAYDYGYTPTDDFSWLSEHRLTASDLAGCSKQELRILRNAIYARHGFIFKSADLRDFFNQFYWYTPRYSNVDKQLSSLERSNIAFIKSFE